MALMRSGLVIRMFTLLLVLTWSRYPVSVARPNRSTNRPAHKGANREPASSSYVLPAPGGQKGILAECEGIRWTDRSDRRGGSGDRILQLNYSATLRSRADVRFYEALNLFGDSDNPTVRSTAAGLLEQMASTRKRYFETTFDQLCVGLFSDNRIMSGILSRHHLAG